MAPHVIIVGGGFGGLSAARALRGAAVRVTLIDKRNYHLFRPMLYQVATGLLSDDEISAPLRSILSHQENVDVLLDEVTGINPNERILHLKHRDLAYDFLILATGIQYNYFGHDEWRRFAPGLESLDDADVIRSKILLAFERAEAIASTPEALKEAQTQEIRRLLTFALVGVIQFDFRITKYTTDEELLKFAALLKEKGQDALRSALEDGDKGRLNPTGRIGNQIAVARKRQQGKDTIITIVTARVMPFVELYHNGRSTDYPFGFLQVKLNEKGEGTGQIMAAAKLRFDKKKGHYEIESYGNQYIKATNVRPWN